MKWNAWSPLYVEPEARTARRWWVGWLQLLCAWVVCMLVCANVGLLLSETPWRSAEPVTGAHRAAACEGNLATRRVLANSAQRMDRSPGKSGRCTGA